MSNYLINTNAKQITFLDNRFYQTDAGYLPSVTTILQAYPKDAHFYTWLKQVGNDADDIRDEAGRRGSTVHNLTELYDNGEEVNLLDDYGKIAYKMNEWAMFERYVEFMTRFKPEIMMNEVNMASDTLGYAGTIDRVMTIDGVTYLIDIKTSNSIHDFYWLQLSAYNELINEAYDYNPIQKRAILWLNSKTRSFGKKGDYQGVGYQLIIRDEDKHDNDRKLFDATHTLWLHQNADMQPKQLTYNLSHKK